MTRIIISLFISFSISVRIGEARILNVPEDFQTIQAGIDASEDGDTVLVGTGRYQENINLNNKTILLASQYFIFNDLVYIDSTIIDGHESGSAISVLNCADTSMTISGFTVTGSNAAGIFCRNSSARLEHLHVTENHSTHGVGPGYGGGMFCYDTTYIGNKITLAHSSIDHNSSNRALGGGIATVYYNMDIFDVVIANNETRMGGGGAYFALQSTIEMEDVSILANNSPSVGGGIFTNCGAHVIGKNVIIRSNHASTNGGGCYASGAGRFSLANSLIFENEADSAGGGLYLYSSQRHYFTNTLVAFNEAIIGSAVYAQSEQLAEFRNTILRGEGESLVFVDQNSWIGIHYSDISGGENSIIGENVVWGDDNIDADPLFLDPDNGDFRLTADSPCIDAGDPDALPDPDGTRADMGAFYFHQRDIEVEEAEIDLGDYAGENGPFNIPVIIRNIGLNELSVSAITIEPDEGPFSADLESCVIGAEGFQELILTVNANDFGDYRGNLIIVSDDPDEDTVRISLHINLLGIPSDDKIQTLGFALHEAYPNPFNAMTRIRYGLDKSAPTRLAVYGMDGRLVADLLGSTGVTAGQGIHPAAESGATESSVVWDASNQPAGVYFIRLEAGKGVRTMKTLLIK